MYFNNIYRKKLNIAEKKYKIQEQQYLDINRYSKIKRESPRDINSGNDTKIIKL